MSHAIRLAEPTDAPILSALARETFTETFGHLYPAQDLKAFLDGSYALDVLGPEIADPRQYWLIAEDAAGVAVGYAQSGPCGLPHRAVSHEHGELKRIYVRRTTQGSGLGRELLERSLAWLADSFTGPVWIGVWSENFKAQRLYAHYGFKHAGEYEFAVGETRDQEYILMRD